MTTPDTNPIIDNVPQAAAVAENADRLGLKWEWRLATVNSVATDGASVVATFDGPSGTETPKAMIVVGVGSPVVVGARVYVLHIPPQGNYVVGTAGGRALQSGVTTKAAGNGNAPAPGSWGDYPGTFAVSLTKQFTGTPLLVWWSATFFTSLASAGPEFAVSVAGVDYKTHQIPGTLVINTRTPSTGAVKIPAGVTAGPITITGRWRRLTVGGTISTTTDDWGSLTVQEVPA